MILKKNCCLRGGEKYTVPASSQANLDQFLLIHRFIEYSINFTNPWQNQKQHKNGTSRPTQGVCQPIAGIISTTTWRERLMIFIEPADHGTNKRNHNKEQPTPILETWPENQPKGGQQGTSG